MYARSARLFLVALTLAALTGSDTRAAADPPTINQPGGIDNSSGNTFNGSTTVNQGVLRLTDGPNQVGSGFWNGRKDFRQFLAQFGLRRQPSSTNSAAGGLAFVLQGNEPTALGPGGAGLGIPTNKSVAVTFGPGNTTGLAINGVRSTTVNLDNTGIDLIAGQDFHVTVFYDDVNDQVLVTQIHDVTTNRSFTTTFAAKIPTIIGGNTGFAGFTGATGAAGVVQEILSFTLNTPPFNTIDATPLGGVRVTGANDNLQMSGNAVINGQPRAGRIDRQPEGSSTFNILALPSSSVQSAALDIDAAGNLAGFVADATGGNRRGMRWNPNGTGTVFTPPAGSQSQVTAVNGDRVVGILFNATSVRGFVHSPTTGLEYIQVAGNPPIVNPTGINSRGFVAGDSSQVGGAPTAFLRFPDGSTRSFRTPTGFVGTSVQGMLEFNPDDNQNDIVAFGAAVRDDGTLQPALFREDGTTQLVPLPANVRTGVIAAAVNNGRELYINGAGINGQPVTLVSQANGTSDVNSRVQPTAGVNPVTQVLTASPSGSDVIGRNAGQDILLEPVARMGSDPADPNKTSLFVKGTASNDVVIITGTGQENTDTITVTRNGQVQGTYAIDGQVVVSGRQGNDTLTLSNVNLPATVFAGSGDDNVQGGNGSNILVGGSGDDILLGGSKRDLLIGGLGVDQVGGNGDDDILVAGGTLFDTGRPTDALRLLGILQQWLASKDYLTRVAAVIDLLLPGTRDDGVTDNLVGGSGQDAFFAQPGGPMPDVLPDRGAGEMLVVIPV